MARHKNISFTIILVDHPNKMVIVNSTGIRYNNCSALLDGLTQRPWTRKIAMTRDEACL
jgi:hypothetical protein